MPPRLNVYSLAARCPKTGLTSTQAQRTKFEAPAAGAQVGSRPPGFGPAVFRIDPLGVMSVIDQPGGQPNGIALSPENDRLYVVGSGTYDLDADGVPTDAPDGWTPNADGLAVDCAGNVYQSGGQIRDRSGNDVGNFPGGTNQAFGGADMKTLLVVHGGAQVRVVTMNVPGLP